MSTKVLLVEDNETTNFINKIVLNKAGIDDINEVLNGLDAYNYLLKNCPDLILLDINMPVMDGWDFLSALKAFRQKYNYNPKIYILTSSVDDKDYQEVIKITSVEDYLIKPIDLIMLSLSG